jgi:hypothetical protein
MPVRLRLGRPRPVAALALAFASLVAAAVVGSIFLSTARDAWTAIAAAGPAGPADGLLLIAGLGGALLSLWLGLGLTLSALSALPGALGRLSRRLAARVAPAAVRKVVAFVLGTTLTAALIPGTAVAGSSHEGRRSAVVASASYEVGAVGAINGIAIAAPDASFRFVSEPPLVTGGMDAAPLPEWSVDRQESPQQGIVVLRGDTLWSIAAHHLGPAATAAEITVEWQRWLSTNRSVIGDDPNLILPGQELLPPAAPGAGS